MITGNNSIIARTVDSKEKTQIGQEKENIALAYNSAIIEKESKKDNTIILDEFNKAIKNYDKDATASSEGSKIIVTFSNGHKYTIYKNGTVGVFVNPPYAKDKLKVTINENETVYSPYYVNYPSAKGTIKCRVLYNDSTYGLQLISVNPVTKVTLGRNDSNESVIGNSGSIDRAQNSYMRAVITLNEKAEEYIKTKDGSILATDARCVGSNPLDKNYPNNLTGDERKSEMYTADSHYTYMNDHNGKYFKSDANYEIDENRLKKIDALKYKDNTYGSICWLASYSVVDSAKFVAFCLRIINGGSVVEQEIWHVSSKRKIDGLSVPFAFRPVFKLSKNVKIIDGEGTEEVPFEIGL